MRRYRRPVLLPVLPLLAFLVGAAGCSTLRRADDATGATADAAATEVTTATSTPPAPSDPTPRTITVTAVGSAAGSADSLVLALGVEVFGAGTGEALTNLATKAGMLTEFLRQYGVADTDVQTTGLWAYPTYGTYTGVGTPPINGYQASESFSVRVDDLAAAGPLLDGAAFTINDALRLQGMAWEMSDDATVAHAARTDAIERAERQASDLADTAGLTLGEVVAVDETPASDQMMYSSLSAQGIPFNPGSLTRYVQVTVTYSVAN
jgi:uncharacterized protein YggE